MERKFASLPFASEFSPSQIDLPKLLEMAETWRGDEEGFIIAVQNEFFNKHLTNEQNKRTLAKNVRWGMIAYGILDRDTHLTEFGQNLSSIKNDESLLYKTLARHILLDLHGMSMIQCIRDMIAEGKKVTLTSLRRAMIDRGIFYPQGSTHASKMRLWLEKSGVFTKPWDVDEQRLREVLGLGSDDFDALSNLTPLQRAFLRSLVNTGITDLQPTSGIVRLAEAVYGVRFPEKSLPSQVLNALERSGFITMAKSTSGRGAKPFLVAPTKKLTTEIIEPLMAQLEQQIDPKLRRLIRKSLQEILVEINESDSHIRGLALEALAFKLMRLLDMQYVTTRLRSSATGGAEVDLIFESTRLIFSRWQIQCKNTRSISLDDVAKEVGLTHMLRSNAIIMVSTGSIGNSARHYANMVMSNSNLAIVMLDRSDIKKIADRPDSIIDAFEREAQHAMMLKELKSDD